MSEARPVLARALAAAVLILAVPEPAAGGGMAAPEGVAAGTARLFDRAQMEGVRAGEALLYTHRRAVPEGIEVAPIAEGGIRLAREATAAGDVVAVGMTQGRRTRRLDPFPASSGNPVLVVFLESALEAIARATGGSPFYLRNRIREALWRGAVPEAVTASWQGASVAAERIVYRPFAEDVHAAELGIFREIALEFVLSAEVPGRFVRLAAATGPGADAAFREEISLIGEER